MWIILKSPVNNIWIWIITNKYLATITHKASWVMELIIQSTKILRKTNGLLFVNKIRKVLYKFSRFIKSSWLKWCFQIIEQNYITRNCFKCLWIGLIYPKYDALHTHCKESFTISRRYLVHHATQEEHGWPKGRGSRIKQGLSDSGP